MNIPKYSLENRKVIYFFLAILLIGGVISFFKLPKKEDAPFVIKTAVLVTQYPGANPHEVAWQSGKCSYFKRITQKSFPIFVKASRRPAPACSPRRRINCPASQVTGGA